jgi:signal transduction histidine kinase/PAS domain-containing protein
MDNKTQEFLNELMRVSVAVIHGDYSNRINLVTENKEIKRLIININQIIEFIEFSIDISLLGDNSLIHNYIDVFSSFANREFDNKLEVSDKGTILDAIAAGINILGEELEETTVSKNELEIERNRLDESQKIAKLGDFEYYPKEKKFVCSKSFYNVLELEHCTIDELINTYKQKLFKEDLEAIQNYIITDIKNKDYYSFENRIILKDRSTKHLLNIVNHILDNAGNKIGYKGIVQDITVLKQSQTKLKKQNDLQKLIANISTSFIDPVSVDFKLKINKILKDCCLFFETDRAYFFKISNNDAVESFEWNNTNVNYDISTIKNRSSKLFDWCISTLKKEEYVHVPDTAELPVEVFPEKDLINEDKVKSFILIPIIGRDESFSVFGFDSIIKNRYWSDEEINGLQIISNILSDAFNRDYFEKSLIIAREKAEESDRLKSAFLMNMSHEIRTPMNGILCFLDLLNEPDLEEETKKEYFEIVNRSGERLLNTINDIIELSKIESGTTELVNEIIDIPELLNYHHDFFKPQTEIKNLKLTIGEHVTGENAVIKTDRAKLDGILINLIKNAIKFTTEGVVEFGNYIKDELLIFYVKDSGRGIPAERYDAIFDRFVHADLNITRDYEGSGLGLSISKAYVETLGGTIWVESEIGIGSTFYFSIPFNVTKQKEKTLKKKTQQKEINLNNTTILIAEDDDASFYFLKVILIHLGIKLLHTTNGKDTVKIVQDTPEISLILMDIRMPELDGLEATRQIRKFNQTVPIIAQTAHAFSGNKKKAKEAGCNDYITKPIKQEELIEMITKYLN